MTAGPCDLPRIQVEKQGEMMNFTAPALLLAFLGLGVQAQTVYKCGNNYSQTMCAYDAPKVDARPALSHGYSSSGTTNSSDKELERIKRQIAALPPIIPPSPEIIEANKTRCRAGILARLRDPESARIQTFFRLEKPLPRYEILKGWFPGIVYTVDVNAKNGFGGYTGSKSWTCSFDLKEQELLSVEAP
ncbi:MAG: hypothetical protein RLZZ126_2051 [Pseudomonadota bacterium]|jgi:hypothetical protein